EGNPCINTLVSEIAVPIDHLRAEKTCTVAAFTSTDHPVDLAWAVTKVVSKVDPRKHWFDADEPDGARNLEQVRQTFVGPLLVLDRCPSPNIVGPFLSPRGEPGDVVCPFSQEQPIQIGGALDHGP